MMSTTQAIITAILASSGLWSVILYMFQRKDKARDAVRAENAGRIAATEVKVTTLENTAALQSKAIVAQMHHELYKDCTAILQDYQDGKRASIDIDELHDIASMYDAYAALGGNGTCKILYQKIQQLPTRQTNRP